MKETKKQECRCEDCVFYDYDEDFDTYSCQMNLDQDEMAHFYTGIHNPVPITAIMTNTKAFKSKIKKKGRSFGVEAPSLF